MSNQKRGDRAHVSLDFYKHTCLEESGPVDDDTITDLMTDLHHYIRLTDAALTIDEVQDFLRRRLSEAADHFEAEVQEDE